MNEREDSKTEKCTNYLQELIDVYDKYIDLLGKEISDLYTFAFVHGQRGATSDKAEEGAKCREKIQEVKNKIVEYFNTTYTSSIHSEEEEIIDEIIDEYFKRGARNMSELKYNLVTAIGNQDIKILSYWSYPSCGTLEILTNKTRSDGEKIWMEMFEDKIKKALKENNFPWDNKIVVGFSVVPNPTDETKQLSPLFFANKDGRTSICLSARQMDNRTPIVPKLKPVFEI
jgi:hypothetical protein